MTGSPKRLLVALALVSCALLAAAGCSDDEGDTTTSASSESTSAGTAGTGSETGGEQAAACEAPPDDDAASVDVTMTEFDIQADATARAGDVVFSVRNDGSASHHLALYRGAVDTLDPGNLDGAELVEEFETLPAGSTCNGTVTLDAGDYTLVCIVPGHAAAGMVSGLTVT